MSLTSTGYDDWKIRQSLMDSREIYGYNANPVSNFRSVPGPQPVGISVDRLGNGQSQVDLESMLRNQSYVSSSNAAYRQQSDAQLQQMLAQQNANANIPCVSTALMPQVFYMNKFCDPLSGIQIDRFDILQYPTQGFMYATSLLIP